MCLGIINILSTFWFSWLSEAKISQTCLHGFDHRQSKRTLCSFQGDTVAEKSQLSTMQKKLLQNTPAFPTPDQIRIRKLSLVPRRLVLTSLSAFFFPAHSRWLPQEIWKKCWLVDCPWLSLTFMFTAKEGVITSVGSFSTSRSYVCMFLWKLTTCDLTQFLKFGFYTTWILSVLITSADTSQPSRVLKSLPVKLCKVADVIVSLAKFMDMKGIIHLGYSYSLRMLDLMFS